MHHHGRDAGDFDERHREGQDQRAIWFAEPSRKVVGLSDDRQRRADHDGEEPYENKREIGRARQSSENRAPEQVKR
jgi:hypothetical protein